ncbi:MAG: AAA family ATPase [Nitrospirae bacterium]|nr:AAA family ATPase [Nitrospirota bacterium]
MNIWKINPGGQNPLWPDCYGGSYICIGWLEEFDLNTMTLASMGIKHYDSKYDNNYEFSAAQFENDPKKMINVCTKICQTCQYPLPVYGEEIDWLNKLIKTNFHSELKLVIKAPVEEYEYCLTEKMHNEFINRYVLTRCFGAPVSWPGNDISSTWSFVRDIQIGDIVIANNGTTKVFGIGIISGNYISPYSTSNPRNTTVGYCHVRYVDWIWPCNGSSQIELSNGIKAFDIKTVTRFNLDDIKTRERFNYILDQAKLVYSDLEKKSKETVMFREYHTYVDLLMKMPNMILQGPPGTGKTYYAKRIAACILGLLPTTVDMEENDEGGDFHKKRFNESTEEGFWSIVQFHPSYNYEDFVRGIEVSTPMAGGSPIYKTVNKILGLMARKALEKWKIAHTEIADPTRCYDKCEKYILIVDEINRANVASVLGELIYALEYRKCEVDTPYQIEENGRLTRKIVIPPNLYIIGTMNTADRSIGYIDYAVRRRFTFIPLLTDDRYIDLYAYPSEECKHLAKKAFKGVEGLFKKEDGTRADTLSPDFHADDVQPGHTYFMARDCETLIAKITYQLYPLLREYYKDGILVSQGDKVTINVENLEIRIDQPEDAKRLFIKIREICDRSRIRSAIAKPIASAGEDSTKETE